MPYISPVSNQTLQQIATPAVNSMDTAKSFYQGQQMQFQKEDRERKQRLEDEELRDRKEDREIKRMVMETQMTNTELNMAMTQQKTMGDFGIGMLGMVQQAEAGQLDPAAAQQAWLQARESLPGKLRSMIPEQMVSSQEVMQGMAANDKLLKYLSIKSKSLSKETMSPFQKIPGTDLYGQLSSKNNKWTNIKSSLDGSSEVGSSEFERHMNGLLKRGIITQATYDLDVVERKDSLKGEITRGSLAERQRKAGYEETKGMRKEYTQGVEHFANMNRSIDEALVAMESGDTGYSDVLLAQVGSQVQDTNVRAFQMYAEFDKSYGNVVERIGRSVSRFLGGSRTDDEKQVIREALTYFKENYSDVGMKGIKNRYRVLAMETGKDPFVVVPPTSPEDIRDFPHADKDEKFKLIKLYFPGVFE